MGSEVLYPIGFGLKWGLVLFLCLSLVYIVLFRFRNSSDLCRTALRTILYVFVVMLLAPSAICVFAITASIGVALIGHFEPPSDRFVILGGAIALGVTMAGAWWGVAALFRHFNRSLQLRVTSE
jgi:hypothetical protein